MSPFDKLITFFERFPGIGGRQAKRFVFHLLTLRQEELEELSKLISNLNQNILQCTSCQRFFTRPAQGSLCQICSDINRDLRKILVVAQDSDIVAVERSGIYEGLYFVLGGTVPLMHDSQNSKLRTPALRQILTERQAGGEMEVILGFAVNPDGENTARYIESVIAKMDNPDSYKISRLGRGLSTGSELEYSDPETIKSALTNRS